MTKCKLFWSISDKFTPSRYYITSLLHCFGNTVSLNLTKTPGPSRCPHWGPPIFTISIKSETSQGSLFGMNNHLVRSLTRATTRRQLRSDHNGTILISFEYYSRKSTNFCDIGRYQTGADTNQKYDSTKVSHPTLMTQVRPLILHISIKRTIFARVSIWYN